MGMQRANGAGVLPAAGVATAPANAGGLLHGLGRLGVALAAVGLGATALTLGGSATLAHVLTRPRDLRRVPRRTIDETVLPVRFRTDDGLAIEGWYLAHAEARDALVICHGFAMNRHELLDIAQGLRARGHAVLLFDFRGHGTSEGQRSTIGLRETREIAAAVDFLQARPELAGRPIGVAGISMGAAAALLATARDPRIAAVAADSSFATLEEIAASSLSTFSRLPTFLISALILRFAELLTAERIRAHRPIDAIAAIAPRPILLIHDETDQFIPVAHAHALYAAARGPKECWITPCLGHASIWAHRADEYVARLDDFFGRALAGSEALAA
ncbi:MAG: alpha/beta hydrolase [Thermomicrobiales bacterium]